MEDNIVQLEGHIEELLDPAHLLLEFLVHFALVWLVLPPMIQEALIQLFVFFGAQCFFDLIFLMLSLADDVGLALGLLFFLLHLDRLLLCQRVNRLIQDVLIHVTHSVKQRTIQSGDLNFTVIFLDFDFIQGYGRKVVLSCGIDGSFIIGS